MTRVKPVVGPETRLAFSQIEGTTGVCGEEKTQNLPR